ncbi:MAG TPA: lysine biosynthesis protein LysW [Verrucomicrobiae bacterium]|nr:lysine biosynthesis protein LysW [Verrucomicrobiae bacterium]
MPSPPTPVACPDCGVAVAVPGDSEVGEVVECPGCGAPLEVVALTPLTLVPFDEEEK